MSTIMRPQRGWECLQKRLLDLKPGDAVTANDLAAQTGVGEESVGKLLEGLARAELFSVNGHTFVRERLRAY
jgi:hypothetical protein